MYPIFAISVIMLSLVIYKGVVLWQVRRELRHLLKHNNLSNIRNFHKWYNRAKLYIKFRSLSEEINTTLREKMSQEVFEKVSSGKGILLCSSLATLLGLLGTVNGMITSFDAMYIYGVGNTKSMAQGISQALITTQTGLLVGITGVLLGNFLTRLSLPVENNALDYFNRIDKEIIKGVRNAKNKEK